MAFVEGSNSELFIGYFSSFVETTVLKFFTKSDTLLSGVELNNFLPVWQVIVW